MVLGLLAHVMPSIFFSTILRSETLVYNSYFFRTAVLQKLFDIRFSYKTYNFSRICLLVKMASKTVTRFIRLRVVPIFPQGQSSEQTASTHENHPTQERRGRVGREKNEGPSFFLLPTMSRLSHMGWFSPVLMFLCLRLPLKTRIWSHCLMNRVEQCYLRP